VASTSLASARVRKLPEDVERPIVEVAGSSAVVAQRTLRSNIHIAVSDRGHGKLRCWIHGISSALVASVQLRRRQGV